MLNNRAIGYIGVDVLNNATVCNEAMGLLKEEVPLKIVSVYRFAQPTFYQDKTLADLSGRIENLYPLGPLRIAWDMFKAPLLFGRRFWKTLAGAIFCPAEGMKQRLRIWFHLLPAVCLATRWRRKQIGHIHAHWAHTATTVAMHTAELLGVSFSFTGHANDLFVHRVGLQAKVRRARFIVCISEYHRQFYLRLGADPKRLEVIYCGIDLERFNARETKARSLPLRIVSVGRLVEKKGFSDLITACASLRNRQVYFECIIGGSGPWEQRLREQVAQCDLQKYVRITGAVIAQEELPELLRSCDVLALPCVRDSEGDMDGLPQVLIEAMACRRPAVSTRLVGIPDLVRDHTNGLLVDAGDTTALADALHRMLVDSNLRNRLAGEAELWATAYFGREETVRRLKALFLWAGSHPGHEPPDVRFDAAPGSEACYKNKTSRAADAKSQRILVVTPAKDEAKYIERTIRSMAAQTHRPSLWIIVDDGSSDQTGEIAERAAQEHSWIKIVRRAKGTERRVGPGVIDAFYDGLRRVSLKDFDFVCKLDADIEFKPNYFADLMEQFAAHPRLGTASGKAYTPVETGPDPERHKLVLERSRDDFSAGLAKLYRRECFEEIGGFVREVMWDGIDCHRCRQLGWLAVSYPNPELAITHLRLMGSSFRSIYHGRMRWGRGQYFMGTHPLYLLAISAYRMAERPWIIGGLCILLGYLGAWLCLAPRFEEPEFRSHLRRWQLHELGGLFWPRRLRRSGESRTLRKVALPPAELGRDAGDIETDVAENVQDLLADMQTELADQKRTVEAQTTISIEHGQ